MLYNPKDHFRSPSFDNSWQILTKFQVWRCLPPPSPSGPTVVGRRLGQEGGGSPAAPRLRTPPAQVSSGNKRFEARLYWKFCLKWGSQTFWLRNPAGFGRFFACFRVQLVPAWQLVPPPPPSPRLLGGSTFSAGQLNPSPVLKIP